MNLIKVKGAVVVEVTDGNGKVTFRRRTENLMVDYGDQYVAHRMRVDPPPSWGVATCMALGTGTVAATKTDTELGAEITATRPGFSGTYSPMWFGKAITFRCLWGPGHVVNAQIKEVGIFNLTSGGDMLSRAVFTSAVNKGANDTLQVTWTMTVAGA